MFLLAAVFFVLFLTANTPGTKHSEPTPTPVSGNGASGEVPEPKPPASGGSTAPTHTVEKKIWEARITVERNQSFNLDTYPISTTATAGLFSVTFVPEGKESFGPVGNEGRVASAGTAKPSLADCVTQLAAVTWGNGTAPVEPASTAVGRWICAETDMHYIARLRYEGPVGEGYKFLAIVYQPKR